MNELLRQLRYTGQTPALILSFVWQTMTIVYFKGQFVTSLLCEVCTCLSKLLNKKAARSFVFSKSQCDCKIIYLHSLHPMLCDFIYIFIKPELLNGLILLAWWSQHSLHLLSRLASPLISLCNVICVHVSACNPFVNQALNRLLREHLSNSTQGCPTSALTRPQKNVDIQLLSKSFERREKSLFFCLKQKRSTFCQSVTQSVFCCSIAMAIIFNTPALGSSFRYILALLFRPPCCRKPSGCEARLKTTRSGVLNLFGAGLMTVVNSHMRHRALSNCISTF